MGITIVNYIDQDLVNKINEQALAREQAASAQNFSDVLSDASVSYSTSSSATVVPVYLQSIFKDAADTYGVSEKLLESIARAESNFNATATSSAGACGIMQLMPSTAASLGVSNIYDVTENIMGGAKYIAQLLEKYNGSTSLALAAYNAGSAAVDEYGGIPPYTETQNYVSKVLSYLNGEFESESADSVTSAVDTVDESDLVFEADASYISEASESVTGSDESATSSGVAAADDAVDADDAAVNDNEAARAKAKELINQILELQTSNPDALNALVSLLKEANTSAE